MLDRERIEKQEKKACIIAAIITIIVTGIVFLGLPVAIYSNGRCAECGNYVPIWQPVVYTSDGYVHHYGCLEDKYHKEAEK